MSFKKEHKLETLIYLALWAILFIAPVVSLSVRTSQTEASFNWHELLMIWREYAVYFVVFLIHNHLLAPTLLYKQKLGQYLSRCLVIVVIFQVYQCNHRPTFERRGPRQEIMVRGERPPMPPDDRLPDHYFDQEQDSLPLNDSIHVAQYNPKDYRPRPFHEPDDHKLDGERPPIMFGQHDIISLIILILMLGMNLGIKLYFKQRGDRKKMDELEKQNLEQQLEYLKYQINPHFFMNTLNNIHALVDIDPEKAKTTILELSKMMRFVLYEGNKKGVPLDREIAFLQNYITLMKLRYTEKVRIKVDIPTSLPNEEVPPLMFITFVENAFKHGVSYRQESFINIELRVDSKLFFTCTNSKIPKEDDKHGGVGLRNVRQRLDLIYGENYTLDIQDKPDEYIVNLTLPL